MSALVLQGGVVTWEQGFGRADIETGERAAPYTPYLIGDLSQMFGATLFLNRCIESGFATVNDPVSAWIPGFPEGSTLGHLAGHVANGAFRYDRGRFATLTPVIEQCSDTPYQKLLDDLFVRLTMNDAAPGTALAAPTDEDRAMFDVPRLGYHAAVIRRMATPYRVTGGRPVRTALAPTRVDAADGIVASVRDLVKFDAALTSERDRVLLPPTVQGAWTQVAPNFPTGLGWFVQNYNGNAVVWHFGAVADGYSSLIVKVPERRLTFVLLANSDQLSAPFELENGDVTASIFARLFLRIYVP